MNVRTFFGWLTIFLVVLAIILFPFFVWEADLLELIKTFIEANRGWQIVSVLFIALLAADIVLPVPSSLVSTMCGTLLGFWSGLLVSWCGMTMGCLLGYVLGARAGRPAAAHLIGMAELERVEHAAERYGHWVLILFRAVPVLAEVSVVFAGISHIRAGRFITVTASSNLGISLVYAGIGSAAADAASFLLAFTGAILVPGIAWFIVKVLE
jgi:uncharacterized membrane protein YdjX (TVP38/TMEM64 family)